MIKKMIVGLSLVFPLFAVAEVHANVKDIHKIIDVCTSSEKIMKDYALIGMKITYHNPAKNLKETIKRLDEDMDVLEKHKLTKKLHNEEVALQKEWLNIENNLTQTPSKKSALSLHHSVDKFAHHCEVLEKHLVSDIKNKGEHYVVLIARLNLDVQELAGDYVLKAWDVLEDDEYYPDAKTVIKDYMKTYNELITANPQYLSENIKKTLKTLKKHFMVFEFMVESKSGRYVPSLIAKKAGKIYVETKKILKSEERKVEK